MPLDLFDLLKDGLLLAWDQEAHQVLYATLFSIVAATFLFFLCSWFTRQWNRAATHFVEHRLWCGLAAVATIVLSLGAVATLRLEEVARNALSAWNASFESGGANYIRVWQVSRKALADSGIDQPSDPLRASLGSNQENGLRISAEATVSEAISIFAERNALLHRLIETDLGPVTERIVEDARKDLEAQKQLLSEETGHDSDVKWLSSPLQRMFVDDIVVLRREMDLAFAKALPVFQQRALWIYGLIFVVVQAIPFVLSGLSAYRQIRIDPKRPRLSRGPSFSTTRKRPSNRYRR